MILFGRLHRNAHEPPEPGWVAIDKGTIVETGHGKPPQRPDHGSERSLITPGFVDAHLHWPQADAVGHDGLELLDWLETAIYPAERAWAEPAVAEARAERALRQMAAAGTLGCAAYLTSHAHSVAAARRAQARVPLRTLAGRVLMDRAAPADLRSPSEASTPMPATARFEESLNPRFAVACSAALLASVGRQAEAGAAVQTHLAETAAECAVVAERFPEATSYTEVYDRFGLLGPRTLLAHALHLSVQEWAMIAKRRCAVVHCPTANWFLEAGTFDLRAAREHGVPVALGSDVAAGCTLSMPRIASAMINAAKVRRMHVDREATVPTAGEAWELIVRGNAQILRWREWGRFEPGGSADLLLLDVDETLEEPLPLDDPDALCGRLVFGWESRWIRMRVLNGAVV